MHETDCIDFRTDFANLVVQFANDNYFDGISLDFQYPDDSHSSDFGALCQVCIVFNTSALMPWA